MSESQQNDFEINFNKNWLLVCTIGYAISGISGVLGGGGAGFYIGNKLESFLSVSSDQLEFIRAFLASVLMGIASGGIANFFQWILLRRILVNGKQWILAGILGSSIGNAINSISSNFLINSTSDDASFLSLFFIKLIITTIFVGFLKGYLEWLILRKELQDSTKWIRVRVVTSLIVVTMSLIEFILRRTLSNFYPAILSSVINLFILGLIEGLIFGAITGKQLKIFLQRKNEISLS